MPCCDMHNEHCEPPSELCCEECTEFHHGLHRCDERKPFALSHHDGSQCVLEISLTFEDILIVGGSDE
jgi:hypothetical protein